MSIQPIGLPKTYPTAIFRFQVLGAIGMGGAKLLDCDQLAAKLLDRVCNPPSVLEMHELGS